MTDIDALIERMKADREERPWNVLHEAESLWEEAADALEELQKELAEEKQNRDELHLVCGELLEEEKRKREEIEAKMKEKANERS